MKRSIHIFKLAKCVDIQLYKSPRGALDKTNIYQSS